MIRNHISQAIVPAESQLHALPDYVYTYVVYVLYIHVWCLEKQMHFIFQLPHTVLSHACLTVFSQRDSSQKASVHCIFSFHWLRLDTQVCTKLQYHSSLCLCIIIYMYVFGRAWSWDEAEMLVWGMWFLINYYCIIIIHVTVLLWIWLQYCSYVTCVETWKYW